MFSQLWAFALALITSHANMQSGWNRHVYDLPPNLFEPASVAAFWAKLTFTVAATCTRNALILFYLRLISNSGRTTYRRVMYFSMVLNGLVCVTFFLLTIFLCS